MDLLCRLCLTSGQRADETIEIFGELGRIEKMPQILAEFFSFQIVENDPVSTRICLACWSSTYTFKTFHNNVQQAQQKLADRAVKPFPDDDHIFASTTKDEHAADDIKQEQDHLDEDNNSTTGDDDEPVAGPNLSPKVEWNEEEDDDDDDNDGDDDDDEDDEDYEEDEDYNGTKTTKKPRNTKSRPSIKDNKQQTRKEQDALLRSECNIICMECSSISFSTFRELSQHTRRQHGRKKAIVLCCEQKIVRRSDLLSHIATHRDPNAYQCKVCGVSFSFINRLDTHMKRHLPDDQKPIACDKCPKRFTTQSLLDTHHSNAHCTEADKTFVCATCDKKFASAAKLQDHSKRAHEFVPEICDICGKEFKTPSSLNLHRTEVHLTDKSQRTRIQCTICSGWVRENYMARHVKGHTAGAATCTVCGKQLQNRGSLNHHMHNVHGGQPHKCTVCGKAFNKSLSLREHMTLHTGQDLYTCPYCPMKFKNKSNLHAHRKKAHFEDWSRDRGKRLVVHINNSLAK